VECAVRNCAGDGCCVRGVSRGKRGVCGCKYVCIMLTDMCDGAGFDMCGLWSAAKCVDGFYEHWVDGCYGFYQKREGWW
jgi:hypothetical protein